MTINKNVFKRALALLVAITVFAAAMPLTVLGADAVNYTTLADASTAGGYTDMLGTANDGNRYSGRVWSDKSVYTDASVTLDKDTAGNNITIQNDDDFMVVYSALGSSTSLTTETATSSNLDVVFVLDNSMSMSNDTRLTRVVAASNELLAGLVKGNNNRVAVVTYNTSAVTIAPLADYDSLTLSVSSSSSSGGNNNRPNRQPGGSQGGNVVATANGTALSPTSGGYKAGTYTQAGINMGMQILEQATNKTGRVPILIVLTDGVADTAVADEWYAVDDTNAEHPNANTITEGVALSTILNASYMKSAVEKAYSRKAHVYSVSVEIESNKQNDAYVVMDPANYFKADSASTSVGREAYDAYSKWAAGSSAVTLTDDYRVSWEFEQLPVDANGNVTNTYGVTKQDVINNINYVNEHYPAEDTEALSSAFDQILTTIQELAFAPITDTTVQEGITIDTPLTYVDFIGEYMEVKSLKAVTLFGKTYAIGAGTASTPTYATNGKITRTTVTTYPVGTGTAAVEHPTLGTIFNVSDNIWLTITEEVTGAYNTQGEFVSDSVPLQTLRVYIKSAALPVILDAVDVDVDGNVTFAETDAVPVRVYYTVGMADAVCKADGNVDLSKVEDAYITANTDSATGKVQFYANRYGVMNAADAQGVVTNGDAHVSFTPSAENRYYYHQNSNAIFFNVTDAAGNPLVADDGEFGVWHQDGYKYTYLSAADIFEWQGDELVQKIVDDEHPLYTYIEFYHVNAATGKGERVYLLAFATWGELKNDLTAVKLTGSYSDSGQALFEYVEDENTVFTVEDLKKYILDNATEFSTNAALANIRARMAVGTPRIHRLHNMTEAKAPNATGTATNAYAPTFNTDSIHVGGIVVWLGNNGVLSVEPEELSIAITKTVAGDQTVSDEFTFTVRSGADQTENVTLHYYNSAGQLAKSEPDAFTGGQLTVTIGDGEKVVITGLTEAVEYTVTETPHVGYNLTSINGDTSATSVTLPPAAGEAATAAFVNTAKEFGNLVISKEVLHSFGAGYTVPDSLGRFVIRTHLVLNGQAVADQTFTAAYSDSRGATTVTTDADGNFEVELAHGESIEIFGLEAGTVANGTELYKDGNTYYTYGESAGKWYTGFAAPQYYDEDAVSNDDQLVIVADATVAAGVVNTYAPTYDELTVDIDLSGTKTVKDAPADLKDTFTFELHKWNGTAWDTVATANAKDGGSITFPDAVFEYSAVGTYSYQVVEIPGNNDGITYDPIKHTFTVTVTDTDMDGKLEVASVVSDHTDTEFALNDVTYVNNNIDFTNYYQSADAVAELNIQKELDNPSGSALVSREGYEFKLYDADDAVVATGYTDATGEAQLVWKISTVGTHKYTLKETNAGQSGMTYAADMAVTVTVKDNNDGTKSVESVVTDPAMVNGEVVVTNVYAPDAATITPLVSKTLTGRAMTAGEFTFELKQVKIAQEPYVKTADDTVLTAAGLTVKNPVAAAGEKVSVPFPTLKFEQVGSYYFTVDELGTDAKGLTYDKNVYHVRVTVTDEGGELKAVSEIYDQLGTENELHFKNTYAAAETTYTVTAQKELTGRDLEAGEFAFNLVGNGESYTVSNNAAGEITFPTLTLSTAGTYVYTLTEAKGGTNIAYGQEGYDGIAYDGERYTVTITVEDDLEGQLEVKGVAVTDSANAPVTGTPTFENTYKAYGEHTLTGMKYVNGGDLEARDHSFELYRADKDGHKLSDQPLQTVENEADGSFAFTVDYELDLANDKEVLGTHYYLVEETDGGAYKAPDGAEYGMQYDARQYLVAVTVTDNGDGTLTTTDTKTRLDNQAAYDNLLFVNHVYDITDKDVYLVSDPTVSVDGRSVSVGDTLGYSITYYNGYDEQATVTIVDTIPEGTAYVDGSADQNGVYADGAVTWELTVPANTTVTVTFQVKVTAGGEAITNEAKAIHGNNTYTTDEVVNYTFEKEVSADKALIGEKLTYNIVYTNNTGKTVSELVITDTLSDMLAYVDGTANLEGVYDADEHTVTWTFTDVAVRETIVVGFDAIVQGGNGTVDNQVVISEDGYEIRTNTVTTEILLPDLTVGKTQAVNGADTTDEAVEVKAGDKVVYTITVTNNGKAASGAVTVTDKLPAGLIVDADGISADGMLEDGVVTWKLESVDVGETVTLTIEATVPAVEEDTRWTNIATIAYDKDKDGEDDTEESNEVELTQEAPEEPETPNDTEEPEEPKDSDTPEGSDAPEEPQRPESPKTGDTTNLMLWFALLFVSGGTLFGTIAKKHEVKE